MQRLILIILTTLLPATAAAQLPTRLVQQADLEWVGSFNLPNISGGGGNECYTFQYPGAIAYDAANDSLFVVSHDHQQWVGEVAVPSNLSGTPTATSRQPCRSVVNLGAVADDAKVGGLHVSGDRLIVAAFSYYDASHSASRSHFVRSKTLSQSGAQGPVRVGSLPVAFTAGYMAPIPQAWRQALKGDLLSGQCCVSIISRSSFGPAVSATTTASVVAAQHPVPATPLVGYPEDHPLVPYGASGTRLLWNGSTRMRGVLLPEGTASVLFFGLHGVGPSCYGTGAQCKDPVYDAQGEHAYPYEPTVWAYNAHELAEVAAGTRPMWDVKPYGQWRLPSQITTERVSGVTVDPATGRIFILEGWRGSNARGRIHVLRIRDGAVAEPEEPEEPETPAEPEEPEDPETPQEPCDCVGEPGPQGPQGPQGEIGPRGEQGPQGPAGPRGETGPAGSQGERGLRGEQGPQGIAGPQGPAGPQGERGRDGIAARYAGELVVLLGERPVPPGTVLVGYLTIRPGFVVTVVRVE